MFFVDFVFDKSFVFLKINPVDWSFFKLFWVDDKDLLLLFSFRPFLNVRDRDFDFFGSSYFIYGLNWFDTNFLGVYSENILESCKWVDILLFVNLL